MGYQIVKLQNTSGSPGNEMPTIVIEIDDKEWDQAYANWLSGKNPTNSKEWKRGIFACTRTKE